MNIPQAITLVYDPSERSLHIDIGDLPTPLAQRLCEMAADELADVTPIDSIVTTISGVEYVHAMIDDDDGDE